MGQSPRRHRQSRERRLMKTCSRCNVSKPVALFGLKHSKNGKSALRSRCKECAAAVQTARTRRLYDEAISRYGGAICAWCGETFRDVLTLDHVNDDGQADRLKYKQANAAEIAKREGYPDGKFQVLCHRCNSAKAHGYTKNCLSSFAKLLPGSPQWRRKVRLIAMSMGDINMLIEELRKFSNETK